MATIILDDGRIENDCEFQMWKRGEVKSFLVPMERKCVKNVKEAGMMWNIC